MKDALGHGSENRRAADALSQGHSKSAPVPVHPSFNADAALRMVRNANDVELVDISRGQRQTLLSVALKQKAQQMGEAFR